MGHRWDDPFTGVHMLRTTNADTLNLKGRYTMNSRNSLHGLPVSRLGAILLTLLVTISPIVARTVLAQEAPSVETLRAAHHDWDANAAAYVPESTMLNRPATAEWPPSVATLKALPHNWDNNAAAYIPESTMVGLPSIASSTRP